MSDLKIAGVQTHQFWEDKAKNLAHFDELLSKSNLSEVDVLVFPEMFHTGFSMNASSLYEEMDKSIGIDWLKQKAIQYDCLTVASLIIKENEKYFNRMVAVYPSGAIEHYDKRYLFSFAGEDQVFSAGESEKIIQYKGWNILLQVCFDLRFPENARNEIVKNNTAKYDFVIYVANWPKKRIQHWEKLLAARAIENQTFLLGVNRIGIDGRQHEYNGKSALYNPMGEIISELEEGQEGILLETIGLDAIQDIREEMNFLRDRK
ncbi:MAG: nitrilase-related carbon-nitrogen hydrolase [Crocinitomicaceae bacterium]